MPASEISRIASTVAVVQIICDLIANWRIYGKEPYQRALGTLSRTKFKFQQLKQKEGTGEGTSVQTNTNTNTTKKNSSKAEKNLKKVQKAEDDYKNAIADVARRHTAPNFMVSMIFIILLRILGTELKGHVIALLPFAPFKFLHRVTSRGLNFGEHVSDIAAVPVETLDPKVDSLTQACSFMFIYMLCSFSIKYYIHRLVAVQAPPEAKGIMSLIDSPAGQQMLQAAGVDTKELKLD